MKCVRGLSPSRQWYLAEILCLEAEQGCARQSEIAERIGVNKSSVTAALRSLAERSLILYEPYGTVTVTPKGRRMAEMILAKRRIIRDFLVFILGMADDMAHAAACRMQSSVPDMVMDHFSASLRSGESAHHSSKSVLTDGMPRSSQSCATASGCSS